MQVITMYRSKTKLDLKSNTNNTGDSIGKLLADCQSFLIQIYGLYNNHLPILGNFPNFSSPNTLNN